MPADLQLIVARDPALLLEQAADGFLVARRGTPDMPFPSPPYLLALRQGGLRDDLIARAARRGIRGWFDPPLCLFHELPAWVGTTSRRGCDDFERAVILGGALRRLAGDVFGRLHRPEDFLRALDRLFGELLAEGVAPEQFREALERRADRDAFERQRDAELALVYREYVAALDRGGLRDGRDGWLDCARAIDADPAGLAARLGGRREIRIVGLQDLRGGWRALLRALQASPALDRVVVYSAEPLDLGSEVRYRTVVCPERVTIATRLFGGGDDASVEETPVLGRSSAFAVRAIVAPDVERELEIVASRIRMLVDDGIPPRRIAVVARQDRPYVDLALTALAKAGVPATARRRVALAAVPAVRAVRTLVAAAAEGWTRHGLVELADQPYLASELDARILDFAGGRRRAHGLGAWQQLLDDVARDAERDEAAGEEADGPRRRTPPAVRCREAATRFARFAARAGALDRSRTLAEWVEWLDAFVADDPWGVRARIAAVPSGRFEVARLDAAGWDGLVAIVARWRAALHEWGGAEDRLDVAAFGRQLADLLDGDVALWTEAKRGVSVLEGLAAAYREFDHVFLVGLEAGRFPLPAPRSAIFDERERRALREAGLPLELRETWDERERELFRVLVAGAGHLTVSYARLDPSGRETTRSAFVDALADVAELAGSAAEEEIPASAVVVDRIRLCGDAAARDAALHAAAIERERAHGRVSPYNGLIADPALVARLAQELGDGRLWSPTQLESYAKCPWSYFSARFLRVARLDDPGDEMDAATRGSLLHDALRRFYRAAAERSGGPVFLRATDLPWAEPLLAAALDETLADARGARWLGDPRLLGARREELRRLLGRFLVWEVQEHEDMDNPRKRSAPRVVRTGVAEHEVAFRDVTLERGGVRFRFRGTIDRIEVGVDPRFDAARFIAAVDYKTTTAAVPGAGDKSAWDDGVVLQVPLYAYAMTHARPGAELARIEYRAVKQRETAHALEFHQFDKKSGQVVRNEAAFEMMERALDSVAAHVRRARDGVFPAAPAPSCGCPRFCHALEICRVAGGPRIGW